LGYLSILHDVLGTIIDSKECGQVSSLSKPASYPPDLLGICCFGGGAGAELVSIAAAVHLLRKSRMGSASLEEKQSSEGEEDKDVAVPTNLDETGIPKVSVLLVDLANWHAVTQALYGSITTAPKLSQYASVAVKAANIPFVSCEDLSQALEVTDVLALSSDHLAQLVGSNVKLVTIFFTLNELYTTSRARTQAFLLELTMFIRPGSFLLVVDSAGSYSTVELNGAEKKYPMHWLLDHTLLKVATATSLRNGEEGVQSESKEKGAQEQEYSRWEKLREEESAWFRIPEGLKYPLELENMRYQLHLYRRLEQQ
jgi:25S rRNA (uracil2843-N3)-methyltransferase